ncbi:unnamed protein product [Lactuca saligna]|uniref:TRASH domain-containing protein n=1 Tax=Lactuca saligna TaxID=75948 RepID=A0AA35ZP16_LACSI|nr:unnamed protein product [Lactuca saligna]
MVLKTELCRFSGQKIYPGRGIRFIRSDSQVFLFANSKCKRYFHNKLKPSKLTWTAMYRKQHKKDIAQEAVKKRRRATKKPYSRAIVGATLEVIQKKRSEKPEVRDAAREAALREIKERIKKTKDEKKAKKAEVVSKQKTQSKGGNAPKEWVIDQVNPGRHLIPCPNSLDPSKDCKFFVWVNEDSGMHLYESKINELHRENMELFNENMNLSKKNMDSAEGVNEA